MSAHVVVISTDFRRANVKVGPGTFLVDVLEEACKKLKLSSDKFLLKHNKKQLDLSLPFRTSGLTSGAKLELVVKSSSPTVVTVALKLPEPEADGVPNGRLTDKFRSDTTLWKLLRHFESTGVGAGKSLNITGRGVPQVNNGTESGSGQLFYESPMILVMGREISSLPEFQKTLSQLGINSGNVLMYLSFKKTDRTLQEAMQDIEQFFRESEADGPKEDSSKGQNPTAQAQAPTEQSGEGQVTQALSGTTAQGDTAEASEVLQPPSTSDGAALISEPMDVDTAVEHDPLRPVGVFSAPTSTTPAAALIEDAESAYIPTIAHAQLHQQRLLESSHNKRLLSDSELAAQAAAQEAKLAAIKSVSVKVRFPDETSAQWTFTPDDTGATLYKAVRSVMASDTAPFKLVLPGGKGHIEDGSDAKHKLIKGYRMEGRVLVSLVWDDAVPDAVRKQPFLKSSVASQAKKLEIPDVPQEEEPEEKVIKHVKAESSKENSGEGGSGKKLPKWLKLPGKK
ncbi:Ubx domain-containing protein [Pleurostoma richardsiae]|uniref:Ubx domain-containing protein n=1 Tax=Pleurostoma richardsiae TaxID=41990 RepID=A0AA38W0P3_9PEZI|nr:Ubx domain-containing protein [Pleurostoma richardsiae]